AGHVLLFRWRAQYPAKHAAILLPENRMIHAQNGSAVTIASLSDWWQRRIAYCFAFPLSQQPLINHEGGRS
ncbi:MAG: hypothetical protein OIF54_17290, partial [Cohaesibacter sp.]|nr:hypothetical protein [Cohaesibacter sp.]